MPLPPQELELVPIPQSAPPPVPQQSPTVTNLSASNLLPVLTLLVVPNALLVT